MQALHEARTRHGTDAAAGEDRGELLSVGAGAPLGAWVCGYDSVAFHDTPSLTFE